MPGDVGLGLKLADTIASWFMSEGGYAEFKKRVALNAKREEAADALSRNDWVALRRITAELERLSDAT